MKTTKFKAMLILIGSMLIGSQEMSAGIKEDLKKFAQEQMLSFNTQGLLVIGGIVGAGLLVYFITNHLIKEKDEQTVVQNPHVSRHHHHRHHHTRPIIKKTS